MKDSEKPAKIKGKSEGMFAYVLDGKTYYYDRDSYNKEVEFMKMKKP